ncbi:MAG: flagellar hook-basal body protein, partial [Desulfotomaculaceae bacterium]|nr:flagellar hook-basal body protein [Desulfotomaculaceae bacterium]
LLMQQGGPKRKDGLPLRDPAVSIGSLGNGSLIAGTATDHRAGTLQETGNPTDIAIKGPGFFMVRTTGQEDPDQVYYTRSGIFKVDNEGYLVLNERYRVLGEAGEIRVGSDKFTVSADGSIDAGGTIVGRLRLVEVADLNSLSKEGECLFTGPQGSARRATETTVIQGQLEASNVNVIDEMAQLIVVMRAYEANQRMIQNYDEILHKAVNQVGSIR